MYPGLNITVGHRPFSEHAQEMTGYTWHLPVKMAGRKHTSTSSSSSFDSSQYEKKDRCQITIRTFGKMARAIQCSPRESNYNVIKTQTTEASSPCYGVSPVESTRLELKHKRIYQVRRSKGHRTSRQAVLYSC